MAETISPAARAEANANLVKRLCLAESIGRIYSMDHPKGKAAVASAYEVLGPELAARGKILLTMADQRLLVDGQPAEDRNPVVARFVAAFQQVQVDTLAFTAGLTATELVEFFRALLQGAKVINAQGGLAALLAEQSVTHVQTQQGGYKLVRDEQPPPHETQPLVPSSGPAKTTEVIPFPESASKPRRPRKPRARKPVVETITARLQEQGLTGDRSSQLAVQLSEFFERELNARTRELKEENQRLVAEIGQMNRLLDHMELAVITWSPEGIVTFVHHSAVAMLNMVAGRVLSLPVRQCLRALEFPLASPEEVLPRFPDLTDSDRILLRAIERVIATPEGVQLGALLRRG